ncbi:MAG: ankyrin repeat domain-containing protein [Winogradskyella sp.]|uniref:ankyrin repeat domain-containing protein n=1 Tax=Winogradskyella sp. TaxID=1883156 RepID=UPI0025EAD6D0|nr:ankyrin repeat domain-containing protein [Winogradskyella sp.]NRB58691.1 ankyrin repeat domain-containing protein [Winogradskyella sp.]
MNKFQQYFFSLTILVSIPLFAQDSNIFLDRAYWKSNPTIGNIEKHIKEGHDVSALNSNAFDAVTYALIEKVDNKTIEYLLSQKGNGVNKITHDGRTYIFWAAYKNNIEMMQYLLDKGAKTDIIDDHGYTVMNFAASTGQTDTKLYDWLITHGADVLVEKNHNEANVLLLVAPYLKDTKLIDYFKVKGISIQDTDKHGNGLFNYTAKRGNISLLKKLVELGIPYQTFNDQGGNAMIFAAKGARRHTNTLEVYEYLESLGIEPNVKTKEGETPLHALAYNCKDIDVINYFLDKGVNPNQENTDGNTPFMNAASRNDLDIIKLLANSNTDLNHLNKKGQSALMLAVQRNLNDVVAYLLENGSDLSIIDSKGNSLAYYLLNAFNNKNSKIFEDKLELLLRAGLNMTKNQSKENTLYHLAVEKNDLELIKRLKDFEIEINAKNSDGLTALHIASMKAKNEIILNYLLSIGADKSIKTDFEETVFDLASENELLKINAIDITFLK